MSLLSLRFNHSHLFHIVCGIICVQCVCVKPHVHVFFSRNISASSVGALWHYSLVF